MYEDMNRLFSLRFKLRTGWVKIIAWDANVVYGSTGHRRIDCELRQHGKAVFPRHATWCAVNRWTSLDGIQAKELVLSLFAMKPGDTDPEYFDSYTPEQLAWAEANGEELGMLKSDRYCDPETGEVRA